MGTRQEKPSIRTVRLTSPFLQEVIFSLTDEDIAGERDEVDALRERDEAAAVIASVKKELSRAKPPVVTSWMSMPERERAEIRPPRRRTATGLLRLVRGTAAEPIAVTSTEGEAA